MTIKKPVKKAAEPAKAKEGEGGSPAAPASSGGAAIASRLKLDAPDPALAKKTSSAGTKYALIAGVLALIVAGILVYTFYKHWEFLMPA